jgi:hypothetical protein
MNEPVRTSGLVKRYADRIALDSVEVGIGGQQDSGAVFFLNGTAQGFGRRASFSGPGQA